MYAELQSISVVTPSFNSADFIEGTIKSVLEQTRLPNEHIVMDGGSDDGTVAILRRYPHLIWTSEHDEGQATALNTGFAGANGDIIAWLNSDDLYLPDTLDFVARYFSTHPDVDIVYGEADWIDERGRFLCHVPTEDFDLCTALCQNPITQPAAFFRRSILGRVGYLNSAYHYLMDYEFWLRAALSCKIRYVPRTLAQFRLATGTKTQERADMFALEYLRLVDDVFQHPQFPHALAGMKSGLMARGQWHAGLALYRAGQCKEAYNHCMAALHDPDFVRREGAFAVRDSVFTGSAHAHPPSKLNWIDDLASDLGLQAGLDRRFLQRIEARFYATRAFYYFDRGQPRLACGDLWRALSRDPAWLANRGFTKRLILSSTVSQVGRHTGWNR